MNGNIKEIICAMLNKGTDCCEVTNISGDVAVTVDITITKIVKAGDVIYDSESDEVDE